jgi:hypothetical protein
MQRLPTLGGDFGEARYINEFGEIAGATTTALGELRATLWRPRAGPLAAALSGEQVEYEAVAARPSVTVRRPLGAGQGAQHGVGIARQLK